MLDEMHECVVLLECELATVIAADLEPQIEGLPETPEVRWSGSSAGAASSESERRRDLDERLATRREETSRVRGADDKAEQRSRSVRRTWSWSGPCSSVRPIGMSARCAISV